MIMFALLSISLVAQSCNITTESVKVYGSNERCREEIETAGNQKNVARVSWNPESKTATLTYDSRQTSKDEILKRIALAGFDNELYYTPDDVYEKLAPGCKYERPRKMALIPDGKANLRHDSQQAANADQQKTSPLKMIIDRYLALKDALVENNGELASKKAGELAGAIDKVSMQSLEGDSHQVWMNVKSELAEHAEHISQTKNLAHQRDHFDGLSKNLYRLVKAHPTGITLYYQHCPMFNEGKGGDWLSGENTIRNPFYGSQMLTCGKTVETLK